MFLTGENFEGAFDIPFKELIPSLTFLWLLTTLPVACVTVSGHFRPTSALTVVSGFEGSVQCPLNYIILYRR